MKKEYTNGEVTVIWQPEKCIHSAVCVKGLPQVFKPKEAPWVKMDQATTNQLIDQIKKCPSGALNYRMNEEIKSSSTTETVKMEVEVMSNGPYIVRGTVHIVHADGRKEVKESSTAFCRCGSSANKPYCDGTHRKIGFEG